MSVWLALPQSINCFDAGRLDEAERERFSALRSRRRRDEFAVSRALLDHVAVPQGAVSSLSHSDGFAALAWRAGDEALGLDLERHKPRDVLSIARFVYSDTESCELASLPESQRLRHFYTLWVMKEALAKALQLNLMDALSQCVFTKMPHEWRGLVPTAQPWRVVVFEPEADLSLAVACVGKDAAESRIESAEWPPAREVDWPVAAIIAAWTGSTGRL
jgi:4'-phosphopantetheinyl transferase